MKNDLTDITVILDRSGSMSVIKTDTEGGFNVFVEEQRKAPGRCLLTLTQFDTEFEVVYAGRPISDVPKLVLLPRGNTALLDAMGKTINETGERLAKMDEKDRPGKVVIVVITDGAENSSKDWSKQKVNELVKQQTEKYQWTFVFLGANQDAIAAAADYGIAGTHAMNYAANEVGTRSAFASTASNISRLRAGAGDASYSSSQRKEQDDAGANDWKSSK